MEIELSHCNHHYRPEGYDVTLKWWRDTDGAVVILWQFTKILTFVFWEAETCVGHVYPFYINISEILNSITYHMLSSRKRTVVMWVILKRQSMVANLEVFSPIWKVFTQSRMLEASDIFRSNSGSNFRWSGSILELFWNSFHTQIDL